MPQLKISVWQKILCVVIIPLFFQITFLILLSTLLKQVEQENQVYSKSKDVLLLVNRAQISIVRNLSFMLTRDSKDPLRYANTDVLTSDLRKVMAVMNTQTDLRPEVRELLKSVPHLYGSIILNVENNRADFLAHRLSKRGLDEFQGRMLPLMFDLQELSTSMLRVDADLKIAAPEVLRRSRDQLALMLFAGAALSIALSFGAAFIFFRDIVERLREIDENARCLAMRTPIKPSKLASDEIGVLAAALENAETSLTESRRKEVAIIDVATNVLLSADRRYRITAAGGASFNEWGFESDELLGRSLLSLLSTESQKDFRATLERISQLNTDAEVESSVVCKDSTVKDVVWKIRWSDNTYYGVAHDISERREAERMKQRFLAIISHDLRTPLSSVSAILSSLAVKVTGFSDEAKKIILNAEANLDRLMDLIRDLLDLEKLEAGKVVLELNCVSALDVCNAACDSVEFLAKSMGVTIVRSHGDSAILGDERRLVRVAVNLLSNAIKFSKRGSSVTVSIANLGEQTKFSVSDSGPGMSREDQENVFNKFTQTKTAETSSIKGTGLGLAIAKLIVDGHGGAIGVDSELGVGSTFYFSIPNFVETDE
ncbi:MAG: HAMP domain-containing histidine kinase [Cyanobacteria bacterium SZAS-4]|nr:HAMP domain-containing histidine kinase [Cyanobacteria bacterium SZAS-4]